MQQNNIDLVIASHPFALSIRCAADLARRFKVPWIADMRDGWTGNLFSPYLEYPTLNFCLGLVERGVLRSASAVVVINAALAETIKCRESQRFVISNAFDEKPLATQGKVRDVKKPLRLIFTGGVKYEHLFRPFLDALKLIVSEASAGIVFDYYGADFQHISDYGSQIDLLDGVMVDHGYVANSVASERRREADLLVIFGWGGPLSSTYQSGKIFDYLAAGVPILCIDYPDSALSAQVRNARLGFTSCDTSEIAAFLLKVSASETKLGDLVKNFDQDEINKYSIDVTGAEYSKLIDYVVTEYVS